MDTLFSRKPFFERHEFIGSLSNGRETVKELHIILQYPLVTQGKITGEIWGNKETSNKLVTLARGSDFFSLQLSYEYAYKVDELPKILINSQKVHITPTEIPSPESANFPQVLEFTQLYHSNTTYKIANIECADITITTLHPRLEDLPARHLVLFLAGNSKIWLLPKKTFTSPFSGERTHEFHELKVDLSEEFSLTVEIIPRFFFEQETDSNGFIRRHIATMDITTSCSEQQLSNEKLVEIGIEVADDLTLLTSLLYKRWTEWYLYELQAKEEKLIYTKHTRKCPTEEIGFDTPLIQREKVSSFLAMGLQNLRKLRQQDFDLLMPIAYYIAGEHATHLEEQFAITFLALEKLKDMFAKQRGFQKNLSDKYFKKLKKLINLSDNLRDNLPQVFRDSSHITLDELSENVRTKIPELNRPPLRFVLARLLAEYEVEWKDLYPPEHDLTIIKTRDSLFHSAQEVNHDHL